MQTKEPKVVALSLELLDKSMINCGNPLHIQVGTKEFMNIIVTLLNTPNFPSQVEFRIIDIYIDLIKNTRLNLEMGYKI